VMNQISSDGSQLLNKVSWKIKRLLPLFVPRNDG
jgi:hypothetical protein